MLRLPTNTDRELASPLALLLNLEDAFTQLVMFGKRPQPMHESLDEIEMALHVRILWTAVNDL